MGDEVTFSAEGSTDPDNNIVSYDWDFGDGKTASGMTVTHNYSQWGSYTAILVVMDSDVLANGAWVNILAVLGVIKVEVTESDDMICYSPYSDPDDIVRMLESQGFVGYDGSGDYDARLVINCEATESGTYGGIGDVLAVYHGTKLNYTIKLYRGSTLLYENAMDAATSAIVDCGGDSMTNYCLCEDAVNNLKPEFEDSFAEMIEILQAALSPAK